MRRQNRSCDQCRRSKRACESSFPSSPGRRGSGQDVESSSSTSGSVFDEPESGIEPCSYCLKTNKRCTYAWARAQLRAQKRQARPSISSGTSTQRQPKTSSAQPACPSSLEAAGPQQSSWQDQGPGSIMEENTFGGEFSDMTTSFDVQAAHAASLFDGMDPSIGGVGTNMMGFLPGQLPDTFVHDPVQELVLLSGTEAQPPQPPIATDYGDYADYTDMAMTMYSPGCGRAAQPRSETVEDDVAYHPASFPGDSQWDAWRRFSTPSFSTFSAEQSMLSAYTNQGISDNLLRIYHDVFEHNLTCWITEDTCPYTVKGMARIKSSSEDDRRPAGSLQKETGATWSNRIYHRVVRLDQKAQDANIIRLSNRENKAATKALHLAMVAFASQWAHGSQRERQMYPGLGSQLGADGTGLLAGELTDEFDRTIQRSLWQQARSALQDVEDLESFKVVCAELIFGLCQKPWDADDVNQHLASLSGSVGQPDRTASRLRKLLGEAIAKDGPPMYVERAARKMHVLKSYMNGRAVGTVDEGDEQVQGQGPGPCLGHGQSQGQGQGQGQPTASEGDGLSSKIGKEEEETIGLMYWLAVMFDTVSSSMNERPVVVDDEDSQHDGVASATPCQPIPQSQQDEEQQPQHQRQQEETSPRTKRARHTGPQRWEVNLFIQADINEPTPMPSWPCSYEEAADTVTRSTTVKVLLFRHISYLQRVVRRRGRGEDVEEVVGSTMALYRYWNVTYGAFFRELMYNYSAVPPRIRGWFVCIWAHWHLAALMFAEMLDFVDKNGFGLAGDARDRAATRVAWRIERASADEVSELSSISSPADWESNTPEVCSVGMPGDPQMPSFHSSVNKGAILSDPWTMIVIRCFAKAAVVHLTQAEDLWLARLADPRLQGQSCRKSLRQGEQCIRALWFLGRKSDMARRVADILAGAHGQIASETGCTV